MNRQVALEPDIFFLLFLPPLLFIDGWRIPKDGLLRDKGAILGLALGLVIFTVAGAGYLIHALIRSIPLAVAFALAAIVSPTDPVAVSAVASRLTVPKRLMHILESESLLNDASGLVCFRFAVAAALTGHFSWGSATLAFVWLVAAGVAIGIGFTTAVTFLQGRLAQRFGEESGAPILLSLLIPFGAYLVAEGAHASGILAVVAAGITMSFVELRGRATASTRMQRGAVWNSVQFALNGTMFVLLGEQLPDIIHGAAVSVEQSNHQNPWWLVAYALAINFGLAALRFIWVWVSLRLTIYKAKRRGEHIVRPSWRLIVTLSVAGVRGAITLAGVLTLPLVLEDGTPFPARELVIFLATAVILLSLLVASVGLPRLLKNIVVPSETEDLQQEDFARQGAASAAIAAVEEARPAMTGTVNDAELITAAAARIIAIYQRRLDSADSHNNAAAQVREANAAERALRLVAIRAEREFVFGAARQLTISDSISRKLVRELDLGEARLL